jgi:thiamine-monophosphate kinase
VTTALGLGPEFDRIRAIARKLGPRASGLGDDCALVVVGGETLALSTDLSVENVHFRRDWLSMEEIGWRAAAGALSDLAAVGADVVGVLTSVAVPESVPEDLVGLMDGIGAAAGSVGGKVLGGDLSSGPLWMIDVTVIGRAVRPVRRAGSKPGDEVWITGQLGGSRAALEVFLTGEEPSDVLRNRFAHPEPRIAAGRWLSSRGARAMIDVSDGLAGDAGHLAAASNVALEIGLESLPLMGGVDRVAKTLDEDPHLFAARGGEDYELLVVLPPEFGSAGAKQFEGETGISLTLIGSVKEGQGAHMQLAGREVFPFSYDHFR